MHTMHTAMRTQPCAHTSAPARPQPHAVPIAPRTSRAHTAPKALQPLADVAADPALLQDIIVGGAIVSAVGFSLYNGLKICPSCQGSGGVTCFACEGSGKMMSVPVTAAKRPLIGTRKDPRTCSVCYGSGLLRCKRCRGSGYVGRL